MRLKFHDSGCEGGEETMRERVPSTRGRKMDSFNSRSDVSSCTEIGWPAANQ